MKIPRVLVVEDEKAIAELISVNLRHHGMLAVLAEDGEAAQAAIDDVLPDVILLDWMLPGHSGLVLAKRWRLDPRTKLTPNFMHHAERVHSRSQLLDRVWGDHVFIEERTVDVHVKRLREALGTAGAMVETVRGVGYRLTASVTPDA